MRLLLDTAVLGEVCHPRKYDDVRAWLALAEGASVVTPNVRHFETIVAALTWRDVPAL